jgi:hypothetical protein
VEKRVQKTKTILFLDTMKALISPFDPAFPKCNPIFGLAITFSTVYSS